MKNPWILISIVTVALFAGAFYFAGQAQESNNEGIELKVQAKGNLESSVVLTEYSDFQCPACEQAYSFVKEISDEFADDLRFEYKHFPIERIHPFALQAATAAEAAGQQDKFFEFHDKLFENQAQWSRSATPNVFFLQYAEELGLDIDLFKRHSNASILRDKVRAEMVEGRDAGVSGTPTFFLNGQLLRSADGRNLSYQEIALQVAAAIDPNLASTTAQDGDSAVVGEAQGEQILFGI